MAIASINNNVIEALHVIKEPVLYTYANRTNRIGRVDMKLLDTPLNKNEETIILQGYLYRRILAMQHGQNKSIVYDTIYKQLEIDSPSAAALRKKKFVRLLEERKVYCRVRRKQKKITRVQNQ